MSKMKSCLMWFGGKLNMLDDLFPFPEHDIFIDVFGGSGVVLLSKIPSNYEIYNDLNERLYNFWVVIKNRCEEVKYLCNLKGDIESRKLFEMYKLPSEDSLEDAFRFFYVNRHSYSGQNDGFIGRGDKRPKHKYYLNELERLSDISERLKYVRIENQDFKQLIKRFNEPRVLLYVDPPYFKGGDEYEKGIGGIEWTDKDQKDLYNILLDFKGLFVLSIDNKDFYHNDNWFYQEIIRTNHSASHFIDGKRSKSIEYIIRNFDINKIEKQKQISSGGFLML